MIRQALAWALASLCWICALVFGFGVIIALLVTLVQALPAIALFALGCWLAFDASK